MQTIALTLHVPGYDIPAVPTIPQGPIAGAILLVPGSLFSDVDGNFPTWNSFPRVYAHLAEGLANRGLASLRFAKLGPGSGSVQTDPVLSPETRSWTGRMLIARAALALMRETLASLGVVPPRTALAGHSEGSVVVSVLAAEGIDVDGIVLLSGPSVGIFDIMLEQNRAMVALGGDENQLSLLEEVIAVIRRGESISDDLKRRASGPTGAGALVNFPPDALRYMRDVDSTDPVAAISNFEKPVLIVQGGVDESVRPHHAHALHAGRGSRPTTLAFFPELQHMYKQVRPGTSSAEAFGYPGPTDPRVDEAIAAWISSL